MIQYMDMQLLRITGGACEQCQGFSMTLQVKAANLQPTQLLMPLNILAYRAPDKNVLPADSAATTYVYQRVLGSSSSSSSSSTPARFSAATALPPVWAPTD
jgi:hypothetical protein